jgi:hypothetical protein
MTNTLYKIIQLVTRWLNLMIFRCSSLRFSPITPSPPNSTHLANPLTGLRASSQQTHLDQEVQFLLEVNIPLNIGSRSVQMRGRHSALQIHMND